MTPLRTRLIRLAASTGDADLRRILLGAVKKDEGGGGVESLLKKHDLGGEDLVDLVEFVQEEFAGQEPKILLNSYKNWWGTKELPIRWQLSAEDFAALVGAVRGELPAAQAGAAAIRSDKGGGGGGGKAKKASTHRRAAAVGLTFLALLAAEKRRKEVAAGERRKERMERAKSMSRDDLKEAHERGDFTGEEFQQRVQEIDSDYSAPSAYSSSAYSHAQGKTLEFKGKTYEEVRKKEADAKWENYRWAKEQLGEKVDRKGWDGHLAALQSEPDDGHFESYARSCAEVWDLVPMVATARKTMSGKALKEKIDEGMKVVVDKAADGARARHKAWVDDEVEKEEWQRLRKLVEEEGDAASFFEQAAGIVAPAWAKSKAESRAKSRADKEQSERKAPRKYEDYLAEKKRQNKRPIPKKEWEARYR